MPRELNIVVAGGGLGIGFQTVTYLLQHTAAKLVVLDVEISKLTVLRRDYPDRLWAIAGDITNRGDREKLRELALQKLQTITSLVITAGVIGEIERIARFSPDSLVKTFNINLIGPILLCQSLLGELRKTKGRAIILSSAVDKNIKYAGWAQYCVSKAALTRAIELLAHEEPTINILGVYPGLTRTGMPADVIAGKYKGTMYDFEVQKFRNWDVTGEIEPPQWCANAVAQLAAGVVEGLPSGHVDYYYEHVPRCKDGWPKARL